MNNKITNPLLKQIISEIANKANEGRVTDINWKKLYESKNMVKLEADEKGADPLGDALGGGGQDAAAQPQAQAGEAPAAPAAGAAPAGGAPAADAGAAGGEDAAAGAEGDAEGAGDEGGGEEDADQAKADAVKAKAELEKAKAEKDQAEKELKNQSYIKLKSSSGVRFMVSKILGQAFKTNTIDSLAGEMVQKLNIKTPEDMDAFSEDLASLKALPGMGNLLSSMKAMATKKTEEPSEGGDEAAPEGEEAQS